MFHLYVNTNWNNSFDQIVGKQLSPWLSARLWYLHCYRNEDTAVLHQAINLHQWLHKAPPEENESTRHETQDPRDIAGRKETKSIHVSPPVSNFSLFQERVEEIKYISAYALGSQAEAKYIETRSRRDYFQAGGTHNKYNH